MTNKRKQEVGEIKNQLETSVDGTEPLNNKEQDKADNAQSMTAELFNKWANEMRHKGIKTDMQCARLLGVSRRTFIRYKENGAGLTVALACQCLVQNLGPYKK